MEPDFPLREKTGLLLVVQLLLAVVLVLIALSSFGRSLNRGGTLCLWAVVAVVLWAVWHLNQRRRAQPALTLTASGIRCPAFQDEIPWTSILSFDLLDHRPGHGLSIRLFLDRAAAAPIPRPSAIACRYVKRRHLVTVTLLPLQRQHGGRTGVERVEREMARRFDQAYANPGATRIMAPDPAS